MSKPVASFGPLGLRQFVRSTVLRQFLQGKSHHHGAPSSSFSEEASSGAPDQPLSSLSLSSTALPLRR